MAEKFIPDIALKYIKDKKLHPAFSYKDVWNEEHATAFTVAKAMQIDVLSDIKGAVEKAIEDGWSFEHFKKELKPTLIKKGWWGKQEMTDPLTGKAIDAQLGSDRRLKTIYNTNLRQAYLKGQYDRGMSSDAHPYIMWMLGPLGSSGKHREVHVRFNGLVLPKDDKFWIENYPGHEWNCKCFVRFLTERRKERYEREGIPTAKNLDGTGGERIPVDTTRPTIKYRTFYNERKGILERVPDGVDPSFNYPMSENRNFRMLKVASQKASALNNENNKAFLNTLIDNTIQRKSFKDFVDNAFSGKHKGAEIAPVGFLDRNICNWLKKYQGINIADENVIGLESRLIKGIKATRHKITKDDADIILDALLYGRSYWSTDPNKNTNKSALIFLMPVDESRWLKIAVRPKTEVNGIKGSFIRSVAYLSNEAVLNDLNGEYMIPIK